MPGTSRLCRISLAVGLLVARAGNADAQSSVFERLQAAAAPESDPHCTASVPFAEFAGRKILFLAKPRQSQRYGFQGYHFGKDVFGSISYEELAGKTGTILSIGAPGKSDASAPVSIRLDENQKIVNGPAVDGEINDIVLLDDLAFARKTYIGKTIWVRSRYARASQEDEAFEGVKIPKYSALKIVDVIPGIDLHAPLDFVGLTGKGETVLVAAGVSLSNLAPERVAVRKRYGGPACEAADAFFFEDPRIRYHWPDSVWADIEQERAAIGMTYAQVVMAKGRPDDVGEMKTANSYSVRLVYPRHYYVFMDANDRVVAIEN